MGGRAEEGEGAHCDPTNYPCPPATRHCDWRSFHGGFPLYGDDRYREAVGEGGGGVPEPARQTSTSRSRSSLARRHIFQIQELRSCCLVSTRIRRLTQLPSWQLCQELRQAT